MIDTETTAAEVVSKAALAAKSDLDERRVMLHMPVDVRSVSLGVLAVMAGIFMLHWAAAVLIPIMLGIMCSYALSPLVDRLERWHLPRALGAAIVVLTIMGGLGSTAWSLSDDAALLAESLPDATRKLQMVLVTRVSQKESTIDIERSL